MSLIFCDGFDHYGTDTTNMTDGAWADISSQESLVITNPRTGTHSLSSGIGNVTGETRRVLGGAKTTVGVAGAWYFDSLPSENDKVTLYSFRDATNTQQVSIILQSTGVIEVKSGSTLSGSSLGDSGTPAITAEAYTHIEALVTIDGSVGEVEVRVNGVTVISLTSVNTDPTAEGECSQVVFIHDRTGIDSGTSVSGSIELDDVFCYDDTGSFNNDFIGDRRVLTLFSNGDTAQADWSVTGAANGFEAIDEADPDDDTTYISTGPGGSPGPVSEFDLDDLPTGVSAISALVVVNRSRKTDAGDANVQMSLVSGSSEANGSDQAITEAYTYYHDVVEIDPSTGAPFTPSAVDAARIKIERTL